MNKFLKRILTFCLFFIFSFSTIAIINWILVRNTTTSICSKKTILILGDSNTECAINDRIFKNAINFSKSSDSYFYSYLKLKNIIKTNNSIDTVLLSFAPHNLFDNGWLLNDNHIKMRIKHYYPLMDLSDFEFIFTNNMKAVFKSVPSILEQSLKNILKVILNKKIIVISGGFLITDDNILDEVIIKLQKGDKLPFFSIPNTFLVSESEDIYLDKIIKLCKSNGLKLYLINTPKRIELLNYKKYGVEIFNELYKLKYNEIEFLDFSEFKLSETNYADLVHLNSIGSTSFSLYLEKNGLKKNISDK